MAAPKPAQTEALPAAHVKFTGMSGSALEKAPGLGDTQTYSVKAVCVGVGTELRKDGERREVRKMEVLEVEFGEIVEAPQDQQLSLVEDDQ